MKSIVSDERGQASLEYLLVGLIFIAMMGALAALWRFVSSGELTSLLEARTSHALNAIGGIADALVF